MAIDTAFLIDACDRRISLCEEVQIPLWAEQGNQSGVESAQEEASEARLFKAALQSHDQPYLDISRIHGGCENGTEVFDLLGRWWHSGQPMTDVDY